MSKQELAGRAAIVTGSGKNIGRSIALALAEKGAAVVVNGSKDRDAVERVVGEINAAGGQAHGVMADVSQDADAARLVASCAQSFGSVDILVSNVGIRRYQSFLEISPADWDTVLRTNLSAAFYLARHAIPHMRERQWGRIVLISGLRRLLGTGDASRPQHHLQGRLAWPRQGAGARVRRRRHHRQHGRARRHRYRARLEPVSASGEAADRERDPLRRFGDPREVAAAVAFLASPDAGFISGQATHVNGGHYMI